MSALLFVAAHFAIQARTQDMAQATVEKWLQRSGGSVEHVRFHLLRNALTLQGVSLKTGRISLFIPEMLLYGKVDSLLSDHPSLARVTMTDPQLEMPVASALSMMASQPQKGGSMFRQIWLMARHLEIHGGTLMLTTGGKYKRSWSMNQMRFLIREEADGRMVQGGFSYHGASLTVHSHAHRTKLGTDGEMDLSWDRLDGRSVTREVFGLNPLHGEISGQVHWSWQEADGSSFIHSHLLGEMRLVGGDRIDDGRVNVPLLHWHADNTANAWHVEVAASNWPLAPFRNLAPVWYDRHLERGYFTGDIETEWPNSDPGALITRVVNGNIRNLDYVPGTWSGNPVERPDWRIDRVDIGNALLNAHTHTLSLDSLGMTGGEIRLVPGQALQSKVSEPWHLEAKAVSIDRLAFALVFADGRQRLRTLPLSGKASLVDGLFQCDVSAMDAPVMWKIVGEGQLAWPGAPSLHLDVSADALPLTQLRALLPFDENAKTGSAVQLDGKAGFTLAVDVNGAQWTASGAASGHNVAVAWQGDSWRAAEVMLNLDKIGNGLSVQALSKLQVNSWQYQGALQSLTSTAIAGSAPYALFPWRQGNHWRLDRAELQGGTVSFGRADAVWVSNVDLQLSGWSDGQMATLKLSGNVNGGALQATGSVGRIDGALHTDIKGSVSHALPFFLNEWLQVSGVPRVVRGRWSSRFTWQTDEQGTDHGHLRLWLRRWQLESGVFPNDPFLDRTGFGAHELLQRLGAEGRLTVLNVNKAWTKEQSFAWSNVGDALLAELKKKANESAHGVSPALDKLMMETRIRLHGMAALSHNERDRLRKLWRRMKANRRFVVDLVPQVQSQQLDEGLVATIRHTEDMIGRFMTDRGIVISRVFPVWPTEADRAQGGLGIRVEVRKP